MDGLKNENSQIKFSQMLAHHAEGEHNIVPNSQILYIFADVRPTMKST